MSEAPRLVRENLLIKLRKLLCEMFLSPHPKTVIKSNKNFNKTKLNCHFRAPSQAPHIRNRQRQIPLTRKDLPSSSVNAPSLHGFIELYLSMRSNFVCFIPTWPYKASLSKWWGNAIASLAFCRNCAHIMVHFGKLAQKKPSANDKVENR